MKKSKCEIVEVTRRREENEKEGRIRVMRKRVKERKEMNAVNNVSW